MLCQPNLLTVGTQALDQRLHQVAVVAALAPCRQLPVGNDDNASRFIEQHDRVVEIHQLLVGDFGIHHVIYDDHRAAEPVFVPLHLVVNVILGSQRVEETLNGVVADLDIRRNRLFSKVAGKGSLSGAAFADDEQILFFVYPAQLFQVLDLPLDTAVELSRQEFLAGKVAVMLKPDIPGLVSHILLLLHDFLQKVQILFGRFGKVDIPAGKMKQLEPFCKFLQFSEV